VNRPHNQCRWCLTRHSPKCSGPRWPVQPLLDVLGSRPVCATLHCSGEEIERAKREGVADFTADRWALRAGVHPVVIWPDWFDAVLTPTDRQYLENGWRQAWEWNNRTNATEEAA